ncbi:MAG: flagellar motor switch protein FliG [Micavibrio sp.]|nr:MAG: flagellar motor switch protein FliG [Micavibrio sp.]
MQVREDYRALSGAEKAAILLLALGEEQAARVMEFMDDEEILQISQTMASLGKVSSNVVERLLSEFSESISSANTLVGTVETTEKLLEKVLGKDRVSAIMEEIRGPAGRTMWDKLGNVNEEMLANFLQKEYPQTVAVVLTKISPEHAANVLGLMPEGFTMEVMMRMLRMEAVQKDILEDVEKILRTEFMSSLARTDRRDAHELMADIFNHFERSTESKFMEALEERSKESAEKIRKLMFTFEDLQNLDPSGIQTLIRSADKEKLPVALKGATPEMQDLFFSNMSERAAKMLKEDIAAMGPVRLRDVEEAQTSLVATAKDLSERGEITISSGEAEDELIY